MQKSALSVDHQQEWPNPPPKSPPKVMYLLWAVIRQS